MKKIAFHCVVSATLLCTTPTYGFSLKDTHFESVANQVGIDPKLVYSVALAESALGSGNGNLGPHPWTLRGPTVIYAKNITDAKTALIDMLKTAKNVDVGLMQLNVRWHGEKVVDPTLLLDPKTNLTIGTSYLAEMIAATPGDLELGIGKYHVGPIPTADTIARARNYGSRVLAIYRNLISLPSN